MAAVTPRQRFLASIVFLGLSFTAAEHAGAADHAGRRSTPRNELRSSEPDVAGAARLRVVQDASDELQPAPQSDTALNAKASAERRRLAASRVTLKPSQRLRGKYHQAELPAAMAESGTSQQPDVFDDGSYARQSVERIADPAPGNEGSGRGKVRRVTYQPVIVPSDGFEPPMVAEGCCDAAGPACGLEPVCGCDSCLDPCAPACGGEAVCGIEPACGYEDACDGYYPRRPWYDRYPYWRRISLHAEYLLWWVDGFEVPPLLSTSTAGTSIEDAGVLGLPTTSIVFGNQQVLDGVRHGGRGTISYWFDQERSRGVEAIYTGLGQARETFTATSEQFPILARPFFNVEPGAATQDAELIAFPGVLDGSATIVAESTLQFVEVLYRHAICCDPCFRIDGLIGWRGGRLDESLRFSDFKEVLDTSFGLPVGSTLQESDAFETENLFNGPQIGVAAQRCSCRWTLEGVMKVALGNNRSTVGIDGAAVFNIPDGNPPVTNTPAGLLAQQSNIGSRARDDFALIPELGVTLGYDINPYWRATLGYSFIYWSRVARPGDQIDTDLNLTQLDAGGLEGEARPAPTGVLTDLWAQGLRFGLAANF